MTSIADRCANRAGGALALVPEDLGAGGSQKQRLGPAPPSQMGCCVRHGAAPAAGLSSAPRAAPGSTAKGQKGRKVEGLKVIKTPSILL